MKKFLFTIAIVLSYVSVAWAPPPGAVVVREGDNIGPANWWNHSYGRWSFHLCLRWCTRFCC